MKEEREYIIGKLLNDTLYMSKDLLLKEGEFYPFAEYLDDKNKYILLNVQLRDCEIGYVKEKHQMLLASLKKLVDEGKCKSFAVALNVFLKDKSAIRIDLRYNENYSRNFIYPYTLENGKIVIEDSYATGGNDIFQQLDVPQKR